MTAAKRPRGGRPTQEQLDERKARVLEIAESLFIARGFSSTTVAEIAKLSGVSPRLITAHFGDKTEIFTGIIKAENTRAAHFADEVENEGTLEEVLFGAAKFAWTIAYAPNAVSFLRLLLGEGERFSRETAEIAERSSDQFFASMEHIFARLIERALIPPGDTRTLAKYFVDLIIGFSLVQAGMGYWDRVPNEHELLDKIKFFCRAMGQSQSLDRS